MAFPPSAFALREGTRQPARGGDRRQHAAPARPELSRRRRHAQGQARGGDGRGGLAQRGRRAAGQNRGQAPMNISPCCVIHQTCGGLGEHARPGRCSTRLASSLQPPRNILWTRKQRGALEIVCSRAKNGSRDDIVLSLNSGSRQILLQLRIALTSSPEWRLMPSPRTHFLARVPESKKLLYLSRVFRASLFDLFCLRFYLAKS